LNCERNAPPSRLVANARVILQQMIDGTAGAYPNTYCLNKLLHLYCRLGYVKEAEDLFHEMRDLAIKNGLSTAPDTATYSMMTDLYFQSTVEDSAAKALSVLRLMENSAESRGLLSIRNEFCYNAVISKLAKSNDPHMVQAAYDLLLGIDDRYRHGFTDMTVHTVYYNTVLSAISRGYVQDPVGKALVRNKNISRS